MSVDLQEDFSFELSEPMKRRIRQEGMDAYEVRRLTGVLWRDLKAITDYTLKVGNQEYQCALEWGLPQKDPIKQEKERIMKFIAQHEREIDFASTQDNLGMAEYALTCGFDEIADLVVQRGGLLPALKGGQPIYMMDYLIAHGRRITPTVLFETLMRHHFPKFHRLMQYGADFCEPMSAKELRASSLSYWFEGLLNSPGSPTHLTPEDVARDFFAQWQEERQELVPHQEDIDYDLYQTLVALDQARQKWDAFLQCPHPLAREDVMSFATIGHASDCFDQRFWKDNPDKATALLSELPAHIAESIIVDQAWLTAPHSNIDATSAARWRATMHKEAQR